MQPDPATELLGNILAQMGRKRVSQRALARQLGISPTAMHRRLRGETRLRTDELLQIAALLDVDPAALVQRAAGGKCGSCFGLPNRPGPVLPVAGSGHLPPPDPSPGGGQGSPVIPPDSG